MKLYVFSLVFALMGNLQGKLLFIVQQPYPEALRKFFWLPLWRGRKHSSWYAHRNDLAVPAHPLAVPCLSEDWWCRCALKCGSGSLPTQALADWHSCKRFLPCLEVPDVHPTSNIQKRFLCNHTVKFK